MRRIIALAVAGIVVLLLVVAQLVLPGLAAQRLRDRLQKSGTVLKVEVHAFPAIELLWNQADRILVAVGRYRSSPGNLGSLIGESAGVGTIDASASQLDTGLLTLRNATLSKRGHQLTGGALVTEADLRAAVPFLDGVQPVASGNGKLTLRGTATVFGVTASVDATVSAQNGRVIVAPDLPFGGLATVTVFSDPHLHVQGVTARTTSHGFAVSATGRLS
jgi:hypothetical protein